MAPDKKTLLLAQVLITFMMASSMSGIMLFIAMGASPAFPAIWAKQFLIAWPIAFLLTLVTSRLGFLFAHRIMFAVRARRTAANQE